MPDPILKIEHVSKFYPGVTALDDVSFALGKGEVRALVGENGAGKSTLIKCIMGVERPDRGHIFLKKENDWVENTNALEAQKNGVYANYQSVTIAPELSIAENYFLGCHPKTGLGFVNWRKMAKDSQRIIDKFKLNVDPLVKINTLSIAMQEMITISKISINDNIRVVIFDEPTALLENEKVEILFRYINELKEAGVSIIYISHRLEEIMDICDSVTVLKDGSYIDTKDISEVTKDSLISLMVGRETTDIYNIEHFDRGEELLRVENLDNNKDFFDVKFSVHAGEIVGFAGLVGAGRSEIMRAIYGLDCSASGAIYVRGQRVRIRGPRDAMKHGIGFLTEDRKADGLALGLPITININMNSYDRISKGDIIDLKKEVERAKSFSRMVNVKTPSVRQLPGNLSGGNQQKVVIAKLLCFNPDILIFDEPTVGVDVGAKQEIYKILESLTRQGKGIILISSYLPEVMGLSDRLLVMAQGKVTADFQRDEIQMLQEKDILKKASVEENT